MAMVCANSNTGVVQKKKERSPPSMRKRSLCREISFSVRSISVFVFKIASFALAAISAFNSFAEIETAFLTCAAISP